jgi:hypothetical protein
MDNQHQSSEYLGTLLSSGSAGVRSWLEALREGKAEAPRGFHWLGLAEAAAHRARTDLDLEWTKTALEILHQLAQSADSRERESLLLAAMNLRAFFIERRGPVPGDPVLDIQDLVTWFRSSTPVSFDQASRDTTHWNHLDTEKIRALRDIKNRLAVFEGLETRGWLDPYADVREWLSLREQLP